MTGQQRSLCGKGTGRGNMIYACRLQKVVRYGEPETCMVAMGINTRLVMVL